MNPTHSFLVPAHGCSPFLHECLESLRKQTQASSILISTSTPFEGIEGIAKAFDADLYVHSPNQGMSHDWNEGLKRMTTDWVTIAHQDDVYLPRYKEAVMEAIPIAPDPTLVFTGYSEILNDGSVRRDTRLLNIKRALLHLGFLGRSAIGDTWSKTNALRFGSPIPCPSVTLRNNSARPHFEDGFRLNMDWAAWLRKAAEPGSFVWVRDELMHHRIHEQSETTDGIVAGYRRDEDLAILVRLWPRPIAELIVRTYGIAYRSNAQ